MQFDIPTDLAAAIARCLSKQLPSCCDVRRSLVSTEQQIIFDGIVARLFVPSSLCRVSFTELHRCIKAVLRTDFATDFGPAFYVFKDDVDVTGEVFADSCHIIHDLRDLFTRCGLKPDFNPRSDYAYKLFVRYLKTLDGVSAYSGVTDGHRCRGVIGLRLSDPVMELIANLAYIGGNHDETEN